MGETTFSPTGTKPEPHGFPCLKAFLPGSEKPRAFMKRLSILGMLMLKRWQPDWTEQDLSSLKSSRNAVQFLYEKSLANGNADITLILSEALTCGEKVCFTTVGFLPLPYCLSYVLLTSRPGRERDRRCAAAR
jgi:hypothetical protein